MITAVEARIKVKSRLATEEEKEISIAEKSINYAISVGNTFCHLGFRISNSSKEKLEALGYNVTTSYAVPNMGIAEDTRISW